MNYRDTEELTVKAITNYYNHDMSTFFQCLHPKADILSVGEGQFVEGAKMIAEKFREDESDNTIYDLEDIKCLARPFGSTACYTIVDCKIMTLFPNDIQELVNERITVLWKYIKKDRIVAERVNAEGWYAMHLHISVAQTLKKEPENYAHASEMVLAQRMAVRQEKKMVIKDINSCVYFVPGSQIVYFETSNYHIHAHCLNGKEIIFRKKMTLLEEETKEKFIRINRKHLVNIDYIVKISNYKLYLMADIVLPVPYDNFKETKERIIWLIQQRDSQHL